MAGETISTKDLLARLSDAGLELGDRQLRNIAEDGFFPAPDRGQWQREKVLLGLAAYYFQLKDKRSKEYEAQELRKITEQADEVAIRNAKSRGELVQTEVVYGEFEKVFVGLKGRILASNLSTEEKDELLNDLVVLTARDLAKSKKSAGDSPAPGGAAEAAPAD